jgi:23S rRNA pseudouridine2605 synthase
MPGDEVKFNDKKINPEKKVYILLNKPKDYVTTSDDPEGRRTVMDLIQNACKERVYPVGRLDRNTTGLLLLTNDGELTEKLTHPSYNKKKIYHVELDKPLTRDHLNQIAEGIELEDGPIVVDAISYVDNLKTEVGIEIHSGRNRIVRRIMEHFGYDVKKLDRVYFAGLTKLNLPRGRWRFLSDQEVIRLKTGMYE